MKLNMLSTPSNETPPQQKPFFVFSILGHSSGQIEDRVKELSHLRGLPCFQGLVQATLTDSDFQREHGLTMFPLSKLQILRQQKQSLIDLRREVGGRAPVLTKKIKALAQDIVKEEKNTPKTKYTSGGCPGDYVDDTGRACENGNDPCDI